ncbi:amidase signature domain-containing protein [Clohesyomyces aquaticus]|uniref:Amidase signature domain-containing protein n=1 Tax=Clohesyomyces aquaticus TaxID=1231657 RepID=A0A1Y2A973_9PLEO|nr:amidase signature domain-containing protein [Clohesyomyces aquaticus]
MASTLNGISLWEERAQDKRRRILSQVPSEFIHQELTHSLEDVSSVQDIPSKYLSPTELATKIYSAVEVLNAFTHRAAIAHRLLHCCLDVPYHASLVRAKELDEYLEKTGNTIGPLHGLPISVKDQCRLIGTETTCGSIYPLGNPDTDDAVVVKILKDAGAVIFAKTSLSIGCMWGETVNNILGRACNPFNRTFSCGGSSGGEGALIGFHASPLGISSDLGGSVRSPSAYQGLCGLRPTSGRIPYYRMLNSMEGQQTILSVAGPMATTAEAVELFTKIVVDTRPWMLDPITSGRKLRIGVLEWDDICLPQPPIRNALKIVAKALKAAGHELVPWKLDTNRAVELVLRVMCEVGRATYGVGLRSRWRPNTLLESWDLSMECLDFRASVLKQWHETARDGLPEMDAFLAPVNPAVAPRHGDYSKVRYFAYTASVNIPRLPRLTIPVGFVDPKMDLADETSLTKDAEGNPLPPPTCERDETIRRKFDPETYKGNAGDATGGGEKI